jgi:hypothetical protein
VVHLQDNGFEVTTEKLSNAQLDEVKQRHGVPESLHECHTGVVNGYVVEGHVPADLIKKLLEEKPEVTGLVAPGMPAGSPGMESASFWLYDVLMFIKDGRISVYVRR